MVYDSLSMTSKKDISTTYNSWLAQWPKARSVWSSFIKLREPILCKDSKAAQAEGLTGSFAMIRLNDHQIVIDLEEVNKMNVQDHGLQILAHEIGHHIYTPANLYDNAILMSRIRWGLAGIESRAPMVANLYEDLLINNRLHRGVGLDMKVVFEEVNKSVTFSKLWMLYMRSYEYLWQLKRGTLATEQSLASPEIDADASLIAGIIRSYSKNWLEGGGRFATLLYPYLMEEKDFQEGRKSLLQLLDAEQAGENAGVIPGLTSFDQEGLNGAVDPRKEALGQSNAKGMGQELPKDGLLPAPQGGVGPNDRYVAPGIYIDLQSQLNPNIDQQKLVNNYYREIALPHLIDFPMEQQKPKGFTTLEGTENWDISDPIEEIDWLQTAIHAPHIIPGYNTVKRVYGKNTDGESESAPLDVYIGVDCSGSMRNPAINFSWPIMAATIIGLSALRAGAKVMGCLSGEPGSYLETDGYRSSEDEVLTVLTSYLGTGYAYGVNRLREPFGKPLKEKSHIVIVTDNDIFAMLNARHEKTPTDHWELIEIALQNAGGEGTIVLHSHGSYHQAEVKRLEAMGWRIHFVTNESELLAFAATFADEKYKSKRFYGR